MKIGIFGTRGIPNEYGGFEQIAEYLSKGFAEIGHEVYVYNPHNHSYNEKKWQGVNLIHCFDPEYKIGTAGQFIYDLNCILDSRKRNFDILFQFGYTSSSIWHRLLPKKPLIITNMDGLEWKRSKYSNRVRSFLKYAERLAIKSSDHFIADSVGIKSYLKEEYRVDSTFLPYGAIPFKNPNKSVLGHFGLKEKDYLLLIARFEPENNFEMIFEGYMNSGCKKTFIVVGNYKKKYGEYLCDKYNNPNIKYVGYVNDLDQLNNLRHYSALYFHGHSVGGTNPSLLEAMASNALICANDNIFNRSILEDDALYFKNAEDITECLDSLQEMEASRARHIKRNKDKIHTLYSWPKIINDYDQYIRKLFNSG